MARQARILTNQLGFKPNDRKCLICLQRFWYPSDDPSLFEEAVRTSCCRKIIGADCLRLFLSPSSDTGGNCYYCPICYEPLLDLPVSASDHQDFAMSGTLKMKVKAFAKDRTQQVNTIREQRALRDCALYRELFEDGADKLPSAFGSIDPTFTGAFPDRQRKEGLDVHQAHALFLHLQREGAFVPIDGKTCVLAEAELYKNLRKAKMFYSLKRSRWESSSHRPVFISRWGYFGTEEELAQKDEERLRRKEEERPRSWTSPQPSGSSQSSHPSRPSRPSRPF